MDVRPNNVLNEQQFGYCVKVELYIRSVSSETTDFLASLLEVTEKTKKNWEIKGTGNYFLMILYMGAGISLLVTLGNASVSLEEIERWYYFRILKTYNKDFKNDYGCTIIMGVYL